MAPHSSASRSNRLSPRRSHHHSNGNSSSGGGGFGTGGNIAAFVVAILLIILAVLFIIFLIMVWHQYLKAKANSQKNGIPIRWRRVLLNAFLISFSCFMVPCCCSSLLVSRKQTRDQLNPMSTEVGGGAGGANMKMDNGYNGYQASGVVPAQQQQEPYGMDGHYAPRQQQGGVVEVMDDVQPAQGGYAYGRDEKGVYK